MENRWKDEVYSTLLPLWPMNTSGTSTQLHILTSVAYEPETSLQSPHSAGSSNQGFSPSSSSSTATSPAVDSPESTLDPRLAAEALTELSSRPLSSLLPYEAYNPLLCEPQICTLDDCPTETQIICKAEEIVAQECRGNCPGQFCHNAVCPFGSPRKHLQYIAEHGPEVNGYLMASQLCLWASSHGRCDVSFPDTESMGQHIYRDHIIPQTKRDCPLSCGQSLDWELCTRHLQKQHQHQRSVASTLGNGFVCLKAGCEFVCDNEEDLEKHYTRCLFHFPDVECHWGSCNMASMNPQELQNHVSSEHLCIDLNNDLPRSPAPISAVSLPIPHRPQAVGIEHHVLRCSWITGDGTKSNCTHTYGSSKELQQHIEADHLLSRNSQRKSFTEAQLLDRSKSLTCRWEGCSRASPFSQPQTLREHIMIHTGCTTFLIISISVARS